MNKKQIAIALGVMCMILTLILVVQIRTTNSANQVVSQTFTSNDLRNQVLKWKERYDYNVSPDSTILDPSMVIVHFSDILGIVNELKNAGAEAISINDQRIVSTTSITCEGNVINVNGEKTSSPFVIKAIGSSIYMNSALTRAGGTVENLNRYIQISVKPSNNITIKKYTGVINPKYIKYEE